MKYSSTVLFNPLNKSNIGNILMFYFHGRSYKTSIQFSFVYSQKYCGILINRWPPPPPTLILRMSPFLISSTTASFLMRRSCDGSTASSLLAMTGSRSSPGPATWGSVQCDAAHCQLITEKQKCLAPGVQAPVKPCSSEPWNLEDTDATRNEISNRMSITEM